MSDISNSSTVKKVKDLIVKNLGIEESSITGSAHFVNDLSIDSIGQMELLMAFEDEFGIEISDDKARELNTLDKVVEFIEKEAKA